MHKGNKLEIILGGIILAEEKVFLYRKLKEKGKWFLPRSVFLFEEKPEDFLKKRIREDTGLEIKISGERILQLTKGTKKQDLSLKKLLLFYLGEANSSKVKLGKKYTEFKWVSLTEVSTLDLSPITRKIIDNYLARKKQEEYLAGWKRCKADFKNYQEKIGRIIEESKERSLENLIIEILPILDNFNLAVEHIPEEEKKAGWVEGVIYIKKQLESFLEKVDVSEIKALGESFNPEFHDCLEETATAEKKTGRVTAVLQKGYLLKGKVIRPVRVKVGK